MSDHEVHMGVLLCWNQMKEDRPGPDEPIEEVAKRAFRLARDESYTWFTTSDDIQFRIGCGVLLMHYQDTPVRPQIEATLRGLKALSAMMSGVPVDLSQVVEEGVDNLPLLPWYKETAA